MRNSVDVLVSQAEHYLNDCCYAEFTRSEYWRPWRQFAAWCHATGRDYPTRTDGEAFAASRGWTESVGHGGRYLRAIRCVFDVDEFGGFRWKTRERPVVPEPVARAVDDYVRVVASRGVRPATVRNNRAMVTRFLVFADQAGVEKVADLTADVVHGFVATITHPATKTTYLYFLRSYLGFVVDTCGADAGLKELFPVIRGHRDAGLPSVYYGDEIRCVIAAADTGRTPLRNRAVILLAVLTGMRSSDIRGLRLDQIDWAARTMSFTQSKTGEPTCLPLPDEAMFAIVDYWRGERPACDDPHVFIRSTAPFTAVSGFQTIITRCFVAAGVDITTRHHGTHAFRHSAAVNMLSTGVQYPVIAAVLGHQDVNTTRRYLRVDVEALRGLSLEVPDAC